MNRKIIPFIVAIVLSCLVMGVAGVFAFSGSVSAEKFGSDPVWSQPFNTAESMKSRPEFGHRVDAERSPEPR